MNRENWNLLSINECADVIGGGTPSTKNSNYWDGNIPWISPKDLSNNKLTEYYVDQFLIFYSRIMLNLILRMTLKSYF